MIEQVADFRTERLMFMAWGNDKVFVEVKRRQDEYAWNVPIELAYNDEKFEITDPVRSMKLFNNAVRYKCIIYGKATELFNEREEEKRRNNAR